MLSNEERLARAVGYFLGEGTVTYQRIYAKTGRGQIRIAVYQSGDDGIPEDLQEFVNVIGVGYIRKTTGNSLTKKQRYEWVVVGNKKAVAILERMRPYMIG